MKQLVAGLAIACLSATAVHAQEAQRAEPKTVTPFSVVVEQTARGWTARCDSGCRWQTASFACEAVCGAVVDAEGLGTIASFRNFPSAFRFTLHPRAEGVVAESWTGTAWKSMSWSCQKECQVRITELGSLRITDAGR